MTAPVTAPPAPAGLVLAAGEGTRLRPLTDLRPKALCPVNGRALLDLGLDRLLRFTGDGPANLAVNAHHHADQVLAHCGRRAHVQVEHGEALGTAGAVGALLPWLDGRDVLVTNADSYLPGGLGDFTTGWDGERCRLLCLPLTPGEPANPERPESRERPAPRADFVADDGTPLRYVGACLLPWHRIRSLRPTPTGLYEVLWRLDAQLGRLDLVQLPPSSVVIDCGTPADYLAANLHASGGASVIGAGATVLGRLTRSVVWPGAWVAPDESLTDQIRAGTRRHPLTVPA